MNKIYRIVFNTVTGRWVVASEIAKGRKKATSKTVRAGIATGALALGAVAAPNAFAGAIVNCVANVNTDYYSIGDVNSGAWTNGPATGTYPSLACDTAANGVILNEISSSGLSTGAYLTVGDTSSTNPGEINLFAPNGVFIHDTMSMLDNKIIGLANGAVTAISTEAINGSQLFANTDAIRAAFGGNATVDAGAGLLTGATYALTKANAINGTPEAAPATDVSTAFQTVDTALGKLSATVTNNNRYFKAGGANDGTDDASAAGKGIAIGANSIATNGTSPYNPTPYNNAIAIGTDASVGGGAGAIAIGDHAKTDFTNIAIGAGASATSGRMAMALGINSTVTAWNAVALGGSSLADRDNTVSVGKNGSERQIVNVAKGVQDTDVVNVSQLKGVTTALGGGAGVDATTGAVIAPSYSVGSTAGLTTVGDAVSALDDRIDTMGASPISFTGNSGTGVARTLGQTLAIQGVGTTAGAWSGNNVRTVTDPTTGAINIEISESPTFGGVTINSAGTGKITGVANGAVTTSSTEAVNGSQLLASNTATANVLGTTVDAAGNVVTPVYTMTKADGSGTENVTNVANAIGQLDGRTEQNRADIAALSGTMADAVLYDSSAHDKVTFGDATVAPVTLANVANGKDGTDAVNVSQLDAMAALIHPDAKVDPTTGEIVAPTFDVTDENGDTKQAGSVSEALTTIDNRVTTVDGRVTTIEGDMTDLMDGKVGLVQYDDASGIVSVAAAKAGTTVDFRNNGGVARRLKGVAAGADDEDAVNVAQLKNSLGGDARYDATTGEYLGPTYYVTNADGSQTPVNTVGDAITNIDGRTYSNTTAITQLTQNISSGTVGMVQQAAPGEMLTVGKDTDGTEVSFANVNGEARKLANVADGNVAADSKDVVNGGQLHTVAQSVADAMGGGSTVNEDGSISAPTYTVTNVDGSKSEVHNVGDAVTNIDGRVYQNTTAIAGNTTAIGNLTTQISNGEVGLVKQDATTRAISVAKDSDGTVVSLAGTAGDRTLTGVAAARADNDAVNLGQLKAAGVVDGDGQAKAVVSYDDAGKTSITMGGEGATKPVAIHNVAEGVAEHDAVNVAQLNERLATSNTSMITQANSYTDQRVNDVWNDLSRDIDQVSRQANRGIAAASALVNVTPYVPGHTAVNAGLAGYRGEAALGVGVSRWSENGRVNFNAGVSAAKGDSPVVRVGVGYVF